MALQDLLLLLHPVLGNVLFELLVDLQKADLLGVMLALVHLVRDLLLLGLFGHERDFIGKHDVSVALVALVENSLLALQNVVLDFELVFLGSRG